MKMKKLISAGLIGRDGALDAGFYRMRGQFR